VTMLEDAHTADAVGPLLERGVRAPVPKRDHVCVLQNSCLRWRLLCYSNYIAAQHRKPTMTKLFTPSTTDLNNMIKAAEAKFDRAREAHLRDRAEQAFAHNARVIRELRAHDMRRRVCAGNRA